MVWIFGRRNGQRQSRGGRKRAVSLLLPPLCFFLCLFADSFFRPKYELQMHSSFLASPVIEELLRSTVSPQQHGSEYSCAQTTGGCASPLLLPFVVLHSAMIFTAPNARCMQYSNPPLIPFNDIARCDPPCGRCCPSSTVVENCPRRFQYRT